MPTIYDRHGDGPECSNRRLWRPAFQQSLERFVSEERPEDRRQRTMKYRLLMIAVAGLALALALVACEDPYADDDFSDYEYEEDGGGSGGSSSLSNTCNAPHVEICVQYTWNTQSDFNDAKRVCTGGSGNAYNTGHRCPRTTPRVECDHESGKGESTTFTYFGPDGRNRYVVDTINGVAGTCRDNEGTPRIYR